MICLTCRKGRVRNLSVTGQCHGCFKRTKKENEEAHRFMERIYRAIEEECKDARQ